MKDSGADSVEDSGANAGEVSVNDSGQDSSVEDSGDDSFVKDFKEKPRTKEM